MKQLVTTIFFLTMALSTWCQSGLGYGDKYRTDDAISITKNIPQFSTENFQVDYTGNVGISIDLYTIESDGVRIPIQLQYNPNRLQVDADADWVGLGWTLDIGGVIRRVVNGSPDDLVTTPRDPYIANPLRGYALSGGKKILNYNWAANLTTQDDKIEIYKNLGNITTKFPRKIAKWDNPSIPKFPLYLMGGLNDVASIANNEGIDTEPDVFYYNLFNRRGKFMFGYTSIDNILKPRTVPYDNIDIQMNVDDTTLYYNEDDISGKQDMYYGNPIRGSVVGQTNGAYSFNVKDDNGCQYLFDVPDSLYVASMLWPANRVGCGYTHLIHDAQSGEAFIIKYNSAWHASKVTTSNGRKINFQYQPNTTYRLGYNRKMTNTDLSNMVGSYVLHGLHERNTTITTLFENKIKTIETDNEKIDFVLSTTNREDVPTLKTLDKIVVYKKLNGQLQEKLTIVFNYDYYNTNTDEVLWKPISNFIPVSGIPIISENLNKRLKLTSIQITNNGNTIPPYTFTYDESFPIPKKCSVKRDLFGYYNKSTNQIPYLYPKLFVYPNKFGINRYSYMRRWDWYNAGETEFTLEGLNRETNQYATVGALKRIINPMGGFIEYEFEPNMYYWFGSNVHGGGIRIKSITTNAITPDAPAIIRNYSYLVSSDLSKSSGKLLVAPILAYGENHCGISLSGSQTTDIGSNEPNSFSRNSLEYIRQFTWRLENPVFKQLADAGDPLVIYSEVTESIPGQGKTTTSYWVPRDALNTGIESEFQNMHTGIESISMVQPLTRIISGSGNWSSPCFGCTLLNSNATIRLDVITPLDLGGIDYSNDSYFSGPRLNLGWATGMPVAKKYYNNLNKIVKEDKYNYQMISGGDVGPVYIPALKQGETRIYNTPMYDGITFEQTNVYNSIISTSHMYYTYFFQLANVKMLLKSVEVIDYGTTGATSFSTLTNYQYSLGNSSNLDFYPRVISTKNSNGDLIVKKNKYVRDYPLPAIYLSTDNINGLSFLLKNHQYSTLLEEWTESIKDGSNTPVLQKAILNEYDKFPNAPNAGPLLKKVYLLQPSTSISNFSPSNIVNVGYSLVAFNKDYRYKAEISIDKVDPIGTILQKRQINGERITTNIIGYASRQPIATVDNAQFNEVAYNSFEEGQYPAYGTIEESKGNWLFDPDYISSGFNTPSGKKFYKLYSEDPNTTGAINTSLKSAISLPSGKTYTLSFWVNNNSGSIAVPNVYNGGNLQSQPQAIKTANGWSYYEFSLLGNGNNVTIQLPQPSAYSIIFSKYIDEVRLYPSYSKMITHAYNTLFGTEVTSVDENNILTHYEYDSFGRLVAIRNENNEIIKTYKYQYQGQ